jgi:hypothetical protein
MLVCRVGEGHERPVDGEQGEGRCEASKQPVGRVSPEAEEEQGASAQPSTTAPSKKTCSGATSACVPDESDEEEQNGQQCTGVPKRGQIHAGHGNEVQKEHTIVQGQEHKAAAAPGKEPDPAPPMTTC